MSVLHRVGMALLRGGLAAQVLIYRRSKGRLVGSVRGTPVLLLTTTGRKTGAPRTVQLAYHRDGDDWLVVASAMGQEHHPAWRHNLEANPVAEILVRGATHEVTGTLLEEDERDRLWSAIKATIPQMDVYEARTDRAIGVFRLRRR